MTLRTARARIRIAIGGEVKPYESRRTLAPTQARKLRDMGFDVVVQSWDWSCYPDSDYFDLDIPFVESTEGCRIVAATKEFSPDGGLNAMHRDQLLLCFHHVHKGQPYNLERLRRALELGCSCFDYELYRIEGNVQPINTSRYAGIAGAANGLWALGRKHEYLGMTSSLAPSFPKPMQFYTVDYLKELFRYQLPIMDAMRILVVGTGACGQGAAEVCSWLKIPQLSPAEVLSDACRKGSWYAVLGTSDVVECLDGAYDKMDYREHGVQKYRSVFERFIGRFNLMIFCPYWDERYPRLLTQEDIKNHWKVLRRTVISDVTCDPDGSIACTRKETTLSNPVRSYCPFEHRMFNDFDGDGAKLTVTAVDNLPTQLAKSCTDTVGEGLLEVLPVLANADLDAPLEKSGLPESYFPAFITWRGELTPPYAHLAKLL